MWEMIEVEVQKVTFRKTKAYLSARKSIALETQNGTSGERDWKLLTHRPPSTSPEGENKKKRGQISTFVKPTDPRLECQVHPLGGIQGGF